MKILITGGTGLIGTHLVPALLAADHTLVVLTRNAKPSKLKGLTFLAWDGKRIPAEAGAADAVINLAGAGIADQRWTDAYKKTITDSRVQGTLACVQYIQAQAVKPKVFISASAVGIYGTRSKEVLTEASPVGNDFLAAVGRKWEMAAVGADCRTVTPRIGVVLAREGGAFPKLLAPFKVFAGGYIGTGEQGLPWIHIDDVVRFFEWALTTETASGIYNLAAPEVLNNKQFGHVLGHVLGKPSALPVPAFTVQLMLGESAMLVLEGQKVKPERLLQAGFTFKFAKADAAVRDLVK
jgi:uncharacterized protein (TIGR01777 family)